ncbi:MAG: AAA family ATPase [Akkermansiaceae bacterium]
MAKVERHQAAIWQDHNGLHTACLLDDSEVIAVSKSRKQALQQIKDYLQYAHKNDFLPEGDFLKPRLTQLKVKVIAEYQENRRTYASKDSTLLNLPCILGERDSGLPTAFIPTMDLSFEYHDEKGFEELATHYVRSFAQGLSPQELSRYLPPSHIELHEIITTFKELSTSHYEDTDCVKSLAQFADHISKTTSQKTKRTWERDHEMHWLETMLSAESNSILLVGNTGSGKTSLLTEAARRAELKQQKNKSKHSKKKQLFWTTNAGRIISGMRYLGQWEERFEYAVADLANFQGTLFIENLQELLKLGGQTAESSIAAFMLPYIQNQELRIVVEATPEELEACDRLLPGLIDQFQVLQLPTFTEEQTKRILARYADAALQQDKVSFAPEALDIVHQLFKRFQPYDSFPGKVMHFMDGLKEESQRSNSSTVDTDLVWLTFSKHTGLPLEFLNDELSLAPSEIRQTLNNQVLGQEPVVNVISNMLSRFKAGMNDPSRPLGVFLCCGPTGVGKTAIVRALGNLLFSGKVEKDRLIRLDMSEYAGYDAATRLLGHPQLRGKPSEMIRKIRSNPFTILLLDEVEKAADEVFDILLNVFDEGRLTDSFGRRTYFNSTIIIMTSNLGAGLANNIGFGNEANSPSTSVDTSVVKKFFRPEFFNRLDQVIYFNALDQPLIEKIARKELTELNQREGLRDRNISLTYSQDLITHLAKEGFDPKYGARPLQRKIDHFITTSLSQHLVTHPTLKDTTLHLQLTKDYELQIV